MIKTQTGDNQTANLMAHAVLGAVEAQVTGNHALSGAVGAVAGELSAKIITEKLYNKTPDKLTEAEKQTVATLSQITGGLTGGLVGDSTASGISSAGIAKRAVENNYLSYEESKELQKLRVLFKQCSDSDENNCTSIKEKIEALVNLRAERNERFASCINNPAQEGCVSIAKEVAEFEKGYNQDDWEVKFGGKLNADYRDVLEKNSQIKARLATYKVVFIVNMMW